MTVRQLWLRDQRMPSPRQVSIIKWACESRVPPKFQEPNFHGIVSLLLFKKYICVTCCFFITTSTQVEELIYIQRIPLLDKMGNTWFFFGGVSINFTCLKDFFIQHIIIWGAGFSPKGHLSTRYPWACLFYLSPGMPEGGRCIVFPVLRIYERFAQCNFKSVPCMFSETPWSLWHKRWLSFVVFLKSSLWYVFLI